MKEIEFNIPALSASYDELSPADRELTDHAWAMTHKSYAPYSHFHVGAAIRLADGTIVDGANQENVAYPSGLCAERTAAFWASANHPGVAFDTIAVAARGTDELAVENPVAPCGACRQSLLEYEVLAGRPVRVILCGRSNVIIIRSVADTLPLAFTEF